MYGVSRQSRACQAGDQVTGQVVLVLEQQQQRQPPSMSGSIAATHQRGRFSSVGAVGASSSSPRHLRRVPLQFVCCCFVWVTLITTSITTTITIITIIVTGQRFSKRETRTFEKGRLQRRQQQLLLSSWYRVQESNETHIRTHTRSNNITRQTAKFQFGTAKRLRPGAKESRETEAEKKVSIGQFRDKKNKVSTKKSERKYHKKAEKRVRL